MIVSKSFVIKFILCLLALICHFSTLALDTRRTPCEKAVRDFTQRNLTSARYSSSLQDSSSSVIVKYWSYEDTMNLMLFLRERIGVEKTIERLRSLSLLTRTNLEQFKRRLFFFEKYIGESEVNKRLRNTLRHFTRGDVQQMEAAAQFLQRYIGDQQTVQVMTQNISVFFKLNVEEFQFVAAVLEEYLGKDKTVQLIINQFSDFSVIRLETLQQIIKALQRFLDEQEIARLIQKHLKLFSALNHEKFSQTLSILETILNISQIKIIVEESSMDFVHSTPGHLQQTISFLKEELWTEEEIGVFIVQHLQIFFNIQPYHLRYIVQELKNYVGVERTRSIVKSSLYKIAQVDQKTFDQTAISVWVQEWTPIDIYIFKNQRGYISFARQYFEGDMRRAWDYAKDSMTLANFNDLNWSYFIGKVEDFLNIKAVFANPKNRIVYRGMEGYQKFADEYFNGYMPTAFKYVSQATSTSIFKSLGWRLFMGFTSEFQSLQKELFDENGELKTEYFGMHGQALLTKKLNDIQESQKKKAFKEQGMGKIYTNVRAVLSEEEFGKLQWKSFFGTVQEFNLFRDRILDSEGNIRAEYIGLEGQIQFAHLYYNGLLKKAYNHAQVILESPRDLKWKNLSISSKDMLQLKKSLENGGRFTVRSGFLGYVDVADTYFGGDMRKAYEVVLALVGPDVLKQKEWRKYLGSTHQYEQLSSILLNSDGSVKEEYIGLEGHIKFAVKHANGNMAAAYSNASAALGSNIIKQLQWKKVSGSVNRLNKIQADLLDSQSSFQPQYREMEGYIQVSDKYFKGNMESAFKIVSAIASAEAVAQLNWTTFKGTTVQLKTLIQVFKETDLDQLKGLEGLNKVAELVFSGKRKAAYINVNAYKRYLFESDDPKFEFRNLNWSSSDL